MSSNLAVYIVSAFIGLVIAFLLINLARLSKKISISPNSGSSREEHPVFDAAKDAFLRHNLYKEISKFAASNQDAQVAADSVADIFGRELERRVVTTQQELSRKYNNIIEQKIQSEEVAWKKYNKALAEKRDTDAVIRNIAEGLVVLDAKGKVIMMNPAAEKLLGTQRKDMVGKSIVENLKEEQLISLVKDSKDKGEKGEKEIELVSQSNETKKVLRASSAVIENENGKTIGMVSVLSDITKQKELDRLKSSFISHVSHELRTPLVAIEQSISLILSKTAGPISRDQEEFLSISQRNLKRLSHLIDDLLDLSKLEAGRMDLKREPLMITKLIDDCVESLRLWANSKSIDIRVESKGDLPAVSADAEKIYQVLNNLLGNAIKFTPSGGYVSIEPALKKEQGVIEVSVSDNGIGIPEEALAKIFDKFYQVGDRIATDLSGTGIGLAIAKEIVELHGGTIRAESRKGEGAKFIFALPVN